MNTTSLNQSDDGEPASCAVSCLAQYARDHDMNGRDVRDVWHAGLAALAQQPDRPQWLQAACAPIEAQAQ